MLSWMELEIRAQKAHEVLSRCRLCGRSCGANRLAGEIGTCGAGATALVAAHLLHYGEEPPISGTRGSGTIFFSMCPLSCLFCQNHQISQEGLGREVGPGELADMMLELEADGAHNINLVSPTPWVPQILGALALAKKQGLAIPVVYNTGGYDDIEALRLMDGAVDIYLPDMKYADDRVAFLLSGVRNYGRVNRFALKEMFRQCGPLRFNRDQTAIKGLLVRHLVLPDELAGTRRILVWLAEQFGPELWIGLMAQYLPLYLVKNETVPYPALKRSLREEEYDRAVEEALSLGLENVFIQELTAAETYLPDFTTRTVFKKTH